MMAHPGRRSGRAATAPIPPLDDLMSEGPDFSDVGDHTTAVPFVEDDEMLEEELDGVEGEEEDEEDQLGKCSSPQLL